MPFSLPNPAIPRGTFSQRHAVLRDQRTGRSFVPLERMCEGSSRSQEAVEVFNSPLNEAAVLGEQAPGSPLLRFL